MKNRKTSYGLEDITKWGTISKELDCRMKYFQTQNSYGVYLYMTDLQIHCMLNEIW